MCKAFNEIIISSGGIKGFALFGALSKFLEDYPLKRIKYYTGCSAGSIICFLLNINYSILEIKEILLNIQFDKFQNIKITNFLEKYGFDEGNKFENFFKALILNKNLNQNITFKELYDLTNINLTITVVNITKGIPEYHNYINTPHLSIFLSLRMSINIPILFSPILYNDHYYIDGALLEPFPYNYNKNTIKIGFWAFDKNELTFYKTNNATFIGSLFSISNYFNELTKIIYSNYIRKKYKKFTKKDKDIIYVNFDLTNQNYENFQISKEDKINFFNIGKKKYNIYKKKKYRLFILKKYFNLIKRSCIIRSFVCNSSNIS